MTITFNNEKSKRFVEVLPSIAFNYSKPLTFYIGWIFWSVIIKF